MAVLLYTPLSKPPSSAEEDRAGSTLAGVRSWTRYSQKAGHPRGYDARHDDTGVCKQAGNAQIGKIPGQMC